MALGHERLKELDRMAAMLSRLGGRGYCVKEFAASYGLGKIDPDPDPDSDESKSQQADGLDARTSRQRSLDVMWGYGKGVSQTGMNMA